MRLNLDDVLTNEVQEPEWVVEGIVPKGTIVLTAGDAGVGKSVLHLAEGLHVALGREFLGHQTRQNRVLYFDEENSRPDVGAYLQQLWIGMGQPDRIELAKWFRIEHFSLGRRDWPVLAGQLVEEWQPGVIYIDTATSALAILEENDNAEAQRAVQALRHLIPLSAAHPGIRLLKHAKFQTGGGHGVVTRRTIRGAKAWLGAVDQVLYHIRRPGRPRNDGLRDTLIIPDKHRAFGLSRNIHVIPTFTETTPKGLILQGKSFESDRDLMVVE